MALNCGLTAFEKLDMGRALSAPKFSKVEKSKCNDGLRISI